MRNSAKLDIDTVSTIKRLAQLCLLNESEFSTHYLMALQPINFTHYTVSLPQNAYFDESEKDGMIGVAGWLATYDNWIKFEQRWREALPPEANGDFHYTDFWHSQKSYAFSWSHEKRLHHVRTLAAIARDCTAYAIGVVLPIKIFKDEFPLEDKHILQSPLHFCLALCTAYILDAQKTLNPPLPSPLRVMFDRKQGQVGTLAAVYYTVRALFDQDEILGDMSFGSRTKDLPLQAADLLIGDLRRVCAGHKSMIMDVLNEKRSLLVAIPTEEELRKYLQHVRENLKHG